MPMDLNALATRTAVTHVDYLGMTAKVVFNPGVITAENFDKSRDGTDEGFVDFFTKLVKSWDVKRGNKVVPITKTGLRGVPTPFLRAVLQKILTDADADIESGKDSSSG